VSSPKPSETIPAGRVSQIVTSLDPSPRRSLATSRSTSSFNSTPSDRSDNALRNRKLSLPPSPPASPKSLPKEDSTPVPGQGSLPRASSDSSRSAQADHLVGPGIQPETQKEIESGALTSLIRSHSTRTKSALDSAASLGETKYVDKKPSPVLVTTPTFEPPQAQVGISEEETEVEGRDLESEARTSFPSEATSDYNDGSTGPAEEDTVMAGVLDEGVFGAVDRPRKALRHRRSKSHDFGSDSLDPQTHLVPPRNASADDLTARNEQIASPLDELIRELGGRRSSGGSSRAPRSTEDHAAPALPTEPLPSVHSPKAENADLVVGDMDRGKAVELELTVEEMDREIMRMERELAQKHQEERRRQLQLEAGQQSHFSASTIAQSHDGPAQVQAPPIVTVHPASNGPPSTPPTATLEGITPRRAHRWSIVELEAAYGRMKDLLNSASKSVSEAPTRPVSPSVNGEGEGEDIETAFEKARGRISGSSFDIDVLDPDLTKLLRHVYLASLMNRNRALTTSISLVPITFRRHVGRSHLHLQVTSSPSADRTRCCPQRKASRQSSRRRRNPKRRTKSRIRSRRL
jgi:hypothetical protein